MGKGGAGFGLVSDEEGEGDSDSDTFDPKALIKENPEEFKRNFERSLFNDQNIQLKGGFKQLYYEVLDKLDVETQCKFMASFNYLNVCIYLGKKHISESCIALDRDGLSSKQSL